MTTFTVWAAEIVKNCKITSDAAKTSGKGGKILDIAEFAEWNRLLLIGSERKNRRFDERYQSHNLRHDRRAQFTISGPVLRLMFPTRLKLA